MKSKNTTKLNDIIDNNKDKWLAGIEEMREVILANLVMVSQIPAPTFKEQKRAEFILNRYIESDLFGPNTDEYNNVVGVLEGENPKKRIMLSSHLDNIFKETDDHNVKLNIEYAEGAGIADNAVGLAVLITLPEIIKKLGIKFESDIVFLSSACSVGKGDLNGIRYFMDNIEEDIDFFIGIEGVQLGRLDYFSLSNVRCDIKCDLNLEEAFVWGELGNTSAILIINDLMNAILGIRVPQRPKTLLNLGLIEGGEAYDTLSCKGSLSFEIRSESDKVTDSLMKKVKEICNEIGVKHNIEIKPEFFGRQHSVALKLAHPLVKNTINILKNIGLSAKLRPTNGDSTVPLSKGIPSINLGVTSGKKSTLPNGLVFLDPIAKGILQVLLLLVAIDKGLCDEIK
jgi:tripeptide aminopeptidase